ncbi:hypothetical protein NESM_000793900 [Novymonas esmeraldas]|uniref:Uncharacterized protein n=1 Tax=Novymonas esmeraldas TaxID=1808958 RepID=A0AAW0EYI9_9TRYP
MRVTAVCHAWRIRIGAMDSVHPFGTRARDTAGGAKWRADGHPPTLAIAAVTGSDGGAHRRPAAEPTERRASSWSVQPALQAVRPPLPVVAHLHTRCASSLPLRFISRHDVLVVSGGGGGGGGGGGAWLLEDLACLPQDGGQPLAFSLQVAADAHTGCLAPRDTSLATTSDLRDGPWRLFCEYTCVQACAEASVAALQRFATVELCQKLPMVVLVAEAACGAVPVTRGAGAQPPWLCPDAPVHRMPVEVYAERTPLSRTSGTASLQLALQRALRGTAAASAGAEAGWTVPAQTHLLWNGQYWLAETDPQVTALEEQLADAQLGDGDGGARVGLRCWLPSAWAASARWRHYLRPALQDMEEGVAGVAALANGPSPTVEAWRCRRWVLRLRKEWLVSSPDAKLAGTAAAAGWGGAEGPRTDSLPPRYPNYDFCTGAPLNLHLYDLAGPRLAAWTASTSPSHGAPPTLHTRRARWGATPSPLDAADPMWIAAVSQQMCWVPVTPPLASSSAESHATAWRLPAALQRSYALPTSAAAVPQRCLTGEAELAAAAAALAETPTHPATRLPLPLASVSVPQIDYRVGFFLDDAPAWWDGVVGESARRWWQTSPSPGHQQQQQECGGGSRATAAADADDDATPHALLMFLRERCGVPPLPAGATTSTTVAQRGHAPPPPPRVCVLRLAPTAPRRRHSQAAAAAAAAASAPALQLQWDVVPDTAVVEVNHRFTLHDVLDRAGAAADPSRATTTKPRRALLCFVEVKAALEVLQRAGVASRDDRSGGPGAVDWWARLTAFYEANTHLARRAAPAAAQDRAHGEGGAASSVCHPTVSEVVEACVRAMGLHSPASSAAAAVSAIRGAADIPHRRRANSDGTAVDSLPVCMWPRHEYDQLLRHAVMRCAAAAVAPEGVEEDAGPEESLEAAATVHASDGDAHDQRSCSTAAPCRARDPPPCPSDLPADVELRVYDEDGTRSEAPARGRDAATVTTGGPSDVPEAALPTLMRLRPRFRKADRHACRLVRQRRCGRTASTAAAAAMAISAPHQRGLSASLDALDLLTEVERRWLRRQWGPWGRYLPLDTSAPRHDAAPRASVKSTCPLQRVARTFHHMRHARAADYCVPTAAATQAAARGASAEVVAVPDLGIGLLLIHRTDVYVNAANLACQDYDSASSITTATHAADGVAGERG